MLAQNTWARRGLYILVSLIVLAGVAVAAYGIGANQANAGPPAGFIERGGPADGPQGNRDGGSGQPGPGNQGGQAAPGFGQGFNQDGPRFSGFATFGSRVGVNPFDLILPGMLGILFVGLLALGAIAFFRTGGWQPQPQPQAAAVEAKASTKKSTKKS
jgi:hypothetical protein